MREKGIYVLGAFILSIVFSHQGFGFEANIDFNAPEWVEERESADNDLSLIHI